MQGMTPFAQVLVRLLNLRCPPMVQLKAGHKLWQELWQAWAIVSRVSRVS